MRSETALIYTMIFFLQSKTVDSFTADKSCTDIFKLRHDPRFQLTTDITSVVSVVVKT